MKLIILIKKALVGQIWECLKGEAHGFYWDAWGGI
jgi:hypothetical protein